MRLLDLAQDLLLMLSKTDSVALGKLAKKQNPVSGQSTLADLADLIDRIYSKRQEFEAFEKAMARTKNREVDITHPDILASQDILREVNSFLEDDLFGPEHDEKLVNAVARFSAAKRGLRTEQRKAIYLS